MKFSNFFLLLHFVYLVLNLLRIFSFLINKKSFLKLLHFPSSFINFHTISKPVSYSEVDLTRSCFSLQASYDNPLVVCTRNLFGLKSILRIEDITIQTILLLLKSAKSSLSSTNCHKLVLSVVPYMFVCCR